MTPTKAQAKTTMLNNIDLATDINTNEINPTILTELVADEYDCYNLLLEDGNWLDDLAVDVSEAA